MKNLMPNRKIGMAGGIGTPLAIVVAWGLGLSGIEVPPEVTAAISSIITFGVGYLVPEV